MAATETQQPQQVKERESSHGREVVSAPTVVPNLTHSLKHPLENEWSFWFFRNDKTKNWEDNLLEITSFETVEDFWALYNHIELVSNIPSGCDYCVFKHGIKPMWEDPKNRSGGRWLFSLSKNQRQIDLDNYWLELLLLMIGEGFGEEFSPEIRGAVVNVRHKGDKLSLWTANYKNEQAALAVGRTMKNRLRLNGGLQLSYQSHEDNSSKQSSVAKARYAV